MTGTTTGKYSLRSNCNGTLTLNNEDGATAHFSLYMNAGSKMFQMIEIDNPSNQLGFGLAQGTVTCGLTGIKKSFTTNIVGLNGSNKPDTVGRVNLDGKGNISGTEVFTNNGTVSTHTVTGTYTEGANCLGRWAYNGAVLELKRELRLMVNDSVSGRLTFWRVNFWVVGARK